ncbi:MAG: glycosyltransferase family 4 protein [Chloroflexi bacterium]|nr:glycosyltransferase family 4 protein [Chloroflexota bacterium]
MHRPYRLAYLVSHPIQYQAPLLRYLSASPEIDLTVYFLSNHSVLGYKDAGFGVDVQWDVDLLDGYKHVFLPCLGRQDHLSFWRPLTHGLWSRLRAGRFDALWVHGYAHQANLRAIAIARLLGMKVLLRGESHLGSGSRSKAQVWIKQRTYPWFFKAPNAFLAIGTLNTLYYRHYGVPADRIFPMPYTVDNDFFLRRSEEASPLREALRAELGFEPGRPVILYASKFQPRKRAADLLDAYIRLSPDGRQEPRPYLLFVGDGEERPLLESRVRSLGWSSVKFLGFRNQTELPRYYDLCDIFALPSEYEPWGLVVNEVMNAGKAVIVSDQVGAGPDLVKEGESGYIVRVKDVEALAGRLRSLVDDPTLCRRMGEESRRRIAAWGFEADRRGLLDALASVVKPHAA